MQGLLPIQVRTTLYRLIMDNKNKNNPEQEYEDWVQEQLEWLAEVHLGR